jgi:glycosyltransferase involved in cell wall biosynthesis
MKASASPSVSIIVCTRDRPGPLRALLDSIRDLDIPADLEWELLVVDNGRSAACSKLIDRFAGSLPIRLVREPVGGLSHARNRGVQEARGDYLCWVDDDTIVDRGWMKGYLTAFRRHPQASVFGGRILARLEEPVPRWLRASRNAWQVKCLFAELDFATADPILADRQNTPWGANYAIRGIDQRRFRYDPDLGLSPDHNRSGEESDLICRLLAGGACGYWAPEALVHHLIPQSRLTRSYLRSYFVKAGETSAFLEARGRSETREIAAGRAGLILGAAAHRLLYRAAVMVGHSRLSVRFLARAGEYEGRLKHARENPLRAASPGVESRSGQASW